MIGTSELRRCARIALAGLWMLAALGAVPARAQQGYVIRGNQVLVDQASHWRAWQGASSLVEISATAGITPLLVRKNINAALDAARFTVTAPTGGGVTVGSNAGTAGNLIDGDPATSWGPDPASPLSDWWLELNLGRLVVVKKIAIHFAAEGEGDPFLQFKVLGRRQTPSRSSSKPRYILAGTDIPRFWEIGRTSKPNKSERLIEFEPRPTEEPDAAFQGDPLDRLQIIATSSDSTRAQEITAEAWQALPVARRGVVEHYRRELSGRETRVSESEYAGIDPARQGPIRYFRREIPRIAEIEVLSEGDNVNLGLIERGGSGFIKTSGNVYKDIGATISDGDYGTGPTGSLFGDETYDYLEDLGALFWVDAIHFLTDGESPLAELVVDVSDGTRAPDGSISYTRVGGSSSRATSTPGGLRYREIRIAPSKVRYLRALFQNPLAGLSYVSFTEVLFYGAGYVPEVVLTSDLIQLGASKNLISIDWDGDAPEGTTIHLQTRTGNQLQEEKIFHDSDGNVVTESRYGRLPASKKGEITSTFLPGNDWSSWSVPYAASGAEITSPSPRQYLQLRTTLVTDRADVAATLRSIRLNMSDPVADRLQGEVWPVRVARVGRQEAFSYFIRPSFATGSQGFDEVMVEATAGTAMTLVGLRAGTDAEFAAGTPVETAAADLEVTASAPDTLQFQLPQRVSRGTDLVEVRMRAAVLGNSASFRTFVRSSSGAGAGLWQRVDEGDATDLVTSQTVTVLALEGADVIQDLSLASPAFTPNGDGINDRLAVRFAVARVTGERSVRLTVHDLGGRQVRRIDERRADSRGRYEILWDGADASGHLVPPGIYAISVDVDVDSESAGSTSLQRVVYVAY